MTIKSKNRSSIKEQVIKKAKTPVETFKPFKGNDKIMISTGSTLLDLAISGGRTRGGGITGGIFVEIFGPNSSGKTVLISELGGDVQRKGGEVSMFDPEGRFDKEFATLFDLDVNKMKYEMFDTVDQIFNYIKEYEPSEQYVGKVNAILIDSLAQLTTEAEMGDKDAYGGTRQKAFSKYFRITCRRIKRKNMLMIASNHVKDKFNATMFEEKITIPGGKAPGFNASLRLRFFEAKDIKEEKTIFGKKTRKTIGTKVKVLVYKNSTWSKGRWADLYLIEDYGIDDIRANLQYIKDYSNHTVYTVGDLELHRSLTKSCQMVEDQDLIGVLKEQVIDLWQEIEDKFKVRRKKKQR